MQFQFSAGGIIYQEVGERNFEFALILDPYNKWTFPKGRIEKKEKPEVAAKREIEEELGIGEVKIISLIKKIDYWFKEGGNLIHKFVYFYLMQAPKQTILKPQLAEIKDAKWFAASEAQKILGYKKDNESLLKKAIEILDK